MSVWAVPEGDPKIRVWLWHLKTLENKGKEGRGRDDRTVLEAGLPPLPHFTEEETEVRYRSEIWVEIQLKHLCTFRDLRPLSVPASLPGARASASLCWCGRQWDVVLLLCDGGRKYFFEILIWDLTSCLCACSSLCFQWSLLELLWRKTSSKN